MAARLTAYIVALIVGVTLVAGLIVGATREADGPVDLIVVNGNVYTADGDGTMAEAVAVQGNKILQVGSNREIQRLRRPQTIVVDAKGGAVLPGLNDAHVNLIAGGLAAQEVDLRGADTVTAIEVAIAAWSAANPDREWVTGTGWTAAAFNGSLPNRQALDALVPDRPAFITAEDGLSAWSNSAALKRAAITRRTPNPANGVIVKDPRSGEPTGVLRGTAIGLVAKLVPLPTREQRITAVHTAIDQAHRVGVTSVQHAGTAEDLEILDAVRRDNALDVRVYAALTLPDEVTASDLDAFDRLRTKYGDDPVLKTGAVVLDVDPATASDRPQADTMTGSGGADRVDRELRETLRALDRRGWQIVLDAVSDLAVRVALNALQSVTDSRPSSDEGRRHRIDSITAVEAADVPRFARLGVIAALQPAHDQPPLDATEPVADAAPALSTNTWSFARGVKSGAHLAFGSGWPSGELDPIRALDIAVNGMAVEGPATSWTSATRGLLRQAIDAYTRNAAWASFDEHRKGTIERDMLADLVILNQDIFALSPARLSEADVAVTIFDGKVVFSRSADSND
jgi:predicted amidohydrolase YtcJ